MQDDIARRVVVEGMVQGVGFRMACARQARSAGVRGWVRNLPDARVEAWVEGPAEPVRDVVEWLAEGPVAAQVTARTVTEEDPQQYPSFTIES